MRKMSVSAILIVLFYISSAGAGGIPVIDVSNIAQQIIQVGHLVTQIENMTDQLRTAQDQLRSMSGSRGLAGVIDSAYDTAVDVDHLAVLRSAGIKGGSEHGLAGDLAALYDEGNSNTAKWLGQAQKSLFQAQVRFSELMGLVTKVNDSPEQKDILDLQARIGAEEAMLQNEIVKLMMIRSQAGANQALHRQKIRQMSIESSGKLRDVSW